MQRPFHFLAVTGQSPQVVTETLFELHREENAQPAAVHVITTAVGRAHGEALLLGKEHADPLTGQPIEGARDRWTPFCTDVLGRSAPEGATSGDEDSGDAEGRGAGESQGAGGAGRYPVPIHFHVPDNDARELDDIRRRGDDRRFGNLCYELVEELTRGDALPLIGSIAGGRKTMSAHMMTAFSVYARPDDRLTHVLLTDPSLERDRSFFYPEAGPGYARLLDLVDIPFPRLRTLLEADLLDDLPEGRGDLQGILDALQPHVQSARTPDRIELHLRNGGADLKLHAGGETLGSAELSPTTASTLAVFADAYYENAPGTEESSSEEPSTEDPSTGRPVKDRQPRGDGTAVPATRLLNSDAVEEKRAAVAYICSADSPKPWEEVAHLSKARYELNRRLKTVPAAERYAAIDSLSGDPVRYDWREKPPVRLEVTSKYPDSDWPFASVPLEAA